MSSKLGQSLDEILKDQRKTRTTRGGARPARRGGKSTTTVAPAGGIKKNTTRPVAKNGKPVSARGAKSGPTGSIIQMSNLPRDVSETQIKDYFTELNKDPKEGRIGTIRKVELMYGPPPASVPLGKVEVSFQQADAAYKAVERLKNLKIDNKTIHLRVILSGDAVPEPPSLSQRITNAPRSAASTKAGGKNAKTAAAPAKAAGKKGRAAKPKSARPSKKTHDELDAEMADYFDGAKPADAAAATNGGDAQMEDEIM
ncbi:unnamed protein product [Discula destructiva]